MARQTQLCRERRMQRNLKPVINPAKPKGLIISLRERAILRNVQPLFAELSAGGLAVAHNGNITNGLTLRRELISQGAICQSTSDTEVILHLVSRSKKVRIIERYIDALRSLEGAYALVAL